MDRAAAAKSAGGASLIFVSRKSLWAPCALVKGIVIMIERSQAYTAMIDLDGGRAGQPQYRGNPQPVFQLAYQDQPQPPGGKSALRGLVRRICAPSGHRCPRLSRWPSD